MHQTSNVCGIIPWFFFAFKSECHGTQVLQMTEYHAINKSFIIQKLSTNKEL
jgi:hypothetical protein